MNMDKILINAYAKINITLDVLNFDKSKDFKLLIPPNIQLMLVTLDVSKEDTSKSVNLLQL